MRECDDVDVQDVLPEYLGGALGAAERARVERHLDACEHCRAELALLREVRAMHRAPTVDVARIVAALPKPPVAVRPADVAPAPPDVVSLDAHRARREAGRGGSAAFPWRRAAGIVAVLFAGGVTWAVTQRGPEATPRAADTPVVRPDPTQVIAVQPSPDTTPTTGTVEPVRPVPPVRPVDMAALGSLGGVASDATDEEIDALIAALDKISGVPEAAAAEAETEEDA